MSNKLKKAVFQFKPFSKKQRRVLNWWCKESPVRGFDGIIADGAIRSGKTLSMSLSFILWAMQSFTGQNFALCGKTIGSFRRNVLFLLKIMLKSRGYNVSDHRSDNLLEITRKETTNFFYVFGGKDESSQDLIQGITLAGVFFDEVALMPESFVNQATGRCSVDGSKFWFNCNPDGSYHWFKTGWVDQCEEKRLLYLHFTMDDNRSLSKHIKKRYQSMYSGVFFKRYILGLWCIAEGLIYDMFDQEKHVFSKEPPKTGRYFISIDYGTVNPTAMLLWNLKGSQSYLIKEFYHDSREKNVKKTDEEYYTDLEKLAKGYLIESVIVDPSASSFIECIVRHNRFNVQKALNAVLDGIRVVGSMLNLGMVMINASCEGTIKEFLSYAWNQTVLDEDKPIKENDHAMDAMRYYVMTIVNNEQWNQHWEEVV